MKTVSWMILSRSSEDTLGEMHRYCNVHLPRDFHAPCRWESNSLNRESCVDISGNGCCGILSGLQDSQSRPQEESLSDRSAKTLLSKV